MKEYHWILIGFCLCFLAGCGGCCGCGGCYGHHYHRVWDSYGNDYWSNNYGYVPNNNWAWGSVYETGGFEHPCQYEPYYVGGQLCGYHIHIADNYNGSFRCSRSVNAPVYAATMAYHPNPNNRTISGHPFNGNGGPSMGGGIGGNNQASGPGINGNRQGSGFGANGNYNHNGNPGGNGGISGQRYPTNNQFGGFNQNQMRSQQFRPMPQMRQMYGGAGGRIPTTMNVFHGGGRR